MKNEKNNLGVATEDNTGTLSASPSDPVVHSIWESLRELSHSTDSSGPESSSEA